MISIRQYSYIQLSKTFSKEASGEQNLPNVEDSKQL